jgi:hypothetical protein
MKGANTAAWLRPVIMAAIADRIAAAFSSPIRQYSAGVQAPRAINRLRLGRYRRSRADAEGNQSSLRFGRVRWAGALLVDLSGLQFGNALLSALVYRIAPRLSASWRISHSRGELQTRVFAPVPGLLNDMPSVVQA